MTVTIRPVQPGDEVEITAMIHELAAFERASAECTVTEAQLRDALFGENPVVYGLLVEVDGQAAGGAGGDVDVVHAHAVLQHALQPHRALQRRRRHRHQADDEVVGPPDMPGHAAVGAAGVGAADQFPPEFGQALRHPAVLAEAGRGGEDDGHADSS